MVTSSSRSSWGLLFRSANWPGISIFESSYSSKTESNILKSWNSKSWNWRNFQKIGNFVKFWSDPPLFSNILKFFYKERIKLTLTYGKISKPVSNGGYSRRSGKSSPVPKWSFLTTSLKIKWGNSFDFRLKIFQRLSHLTKTKWNKIKKCEKIHFSFDKMIFE